MDFLQYFEKVKGDFKSCGPSDCVSSHIKIQCIPVWKYVCIAEGFNLKLIYCAMLNIRNRVSEIYYFKVKVST